jgi:hypothetical protein
LLGVHFAQTLVALHRGYGGTRCTSTKGAKKELDLNPKTIL